MSWSGCRLRLFDGKRAEIDILVLSELVKAFLSVSGEEVGTVAGIREVRITDLPYQVELCRRHGFVARDGLVAHPHKQFAVFDAGILRSELLIDVRLIPAVALKIVAIVVGPFEAEGIERGHQGTVLQPENLGRDSSSGCLGRGAAMRLFLDHDRKLRPESKSATDMTNSWRWMLEG